MKGIIFASLLSIASAFAPTLLTQTRVGSSLDAMSQSVPFLTAPKGTKGWVGDVEFDPIGFTEWFDMKWLREAEIKHGRVSMLAALGFWQQQYVTLPGMTPVADSNLAPSVVGASAMLQIIVWMGVLEFWTNKGNVTMETMFKDPKRIPGDLGFDPLGLASGKSKEEMERMQLRELKNGRLAMLAIGGMIHHNW
eukprot:CAMPEP_0118653320 /NCGR_PEP_ID=MMETSP0785-20121206/11771_1 /TAXON_ID=91992 /ORGANISM="Bolidomonas pacifica, Strain CCMP 1866" /LENGTH=193 /DNA_ID=CAMNT_0006545861 /DNA_START=15 /DNA_END=593 /DNA_ORIENTATION=+